MKGEIEIEKIIVFEDTDVMIAVFGQNDKNLKLIEEEFSVSLISRGTDVKIIGETENIELAEKAMSAMVDLYKKNLPLDDQAVQYCLSLAKENKTSQISELTGEFLLITNTGKPIRPKTLGQKEYFNAIKNHDITFGIGPAGTGKTYLAVAMAVKAYKAHEVSRIIITRPAVEAGEKLGFLPGDLQTKVDPYLRPLYDALFDMLGIEAAQRLMEKQVVEVAPLAYMRGRTLDEAFIILDEAQNTSREQMKMFLTRMGSSSKVVVTGDITQIDLPDKSKSGLVDAMAVLKNIDGISFVHFTEKDVVRHKLVQDIIKAYNLYYSNNKEKSPNKFKKKQGAH